jgi:hypothetical protein
MSQQRLSQQIVHHFYAAITKYVFQHPEYGNVYVQDPIRLGVAEEYGLSPLILYGLTVAGPVPGYRRHLPPGLQGTCGQYPGDEEICETVRRVLDQCCVAA